MTTAIINGSPKKTSGASLAICNTMRELIPGNVLCFRAIELTGPSGSRDDIRRILEADTVLFVFPLYVDSLPAPLLKLLTMLEKEAHHHPVKNTRVYAVCHSGFYDAHQNKDALDTVSHFCKRMNFQWQYGLGIGAGVFLGSPNPSLSKGPAAPVNKTVKDMAGHIAKNANPVDNVFITPAMPRNMYFFFGNLGWAYSAWSNKVLGKIRAEPFLTR